MVVEDRALRRVGAVDGAERRAVREELLGRGVRGEVGQLLAGGLLVLPRVVAVVLVDVGGADLRQQQPALEQIARRSGRSVRALKVATVGLMPPSVTKIRLRISIARV